MAKATDKQKVPSDRARSFMTWMREHNTNTSQVSKFARVSYSTLASFVQGATQQLLGGKEEQIALAYETDTSEIFGGAQRKEHSGPLPYIAWVTAGQFVDPEAQPPAAVDKIDLGKLPPGDYFATKVSGDSMDRVSPDGSTIVVNRAETELVPGRAYLFGRRGETTYKRYQADPPRLEPFSTNPHNEAIFPKGEDTWLVIGRVRRTIFDL